jgi:tetratricopeptide (TPR) repeat protein
MRKYIPIGYLLLLFSVLSSCSSLPGQSEVRNLEKKNKAAGYLENGIRQYNSGRYTQAVDLFQLAYQLNASVDYEEGIILALNSIGKTKLAELKHDEAFDYFQKALAVSERIDNRDLILQTKGNLGDYYAKTGDLEKAYNLIFEEIKREKSITTVESAYLAHSLSLILRKQGKYEDALDFLNESLAYNQKHKAYRAMAADYYMMSSLYSLQKNYQEAMDLALQALEYDKMIEYSQGIAADLEALSRISGKMGNKEESEMYKVRSGIVLKAIGIVNEIENEQMEIENNLSQ